MSENYGTVVQVIGPSVDIRFAADTLPQILNALVITDEAKAIHLTLEVAQHIGNNTVRQATITRELSEIVGTVEALK